MAEPPRKEGVRARKAREEREMTEAFERDFKTFASTNTSPLASLDIDAFIQTCGQNQRIRAVCADLSTAIETRVAFSLLVGTVLLNSSHSQIIRVCHDPNTIVFPFCGYRPTIEQRSVQVEIKIRDIWERLVARDLFTNPTLITAAIRWIAFVEPELVNRGSYEHYKPDLDRNYTSDAALDMLRLVNANFKELYLGPMVYKALLPGGTDVDVSWTVSGTAYGASSARVAANGTMDVASLDASVAFTISARGASATSDRNTLFPFRMLSLPNRADPRALLAYVDSIAADTVPARTEESTTVYPIEPILEMFLDPKVAKQPRDYVHLIPTLDIQRTRLLYDTDPIVKNPGVPDDISAQMDATFYALLDLKAEDQKTFKSRLAALERKYRVSEGSLPRPDRTFREKEFQPTWARRNTFHISSLRITHHGRVLVDLSRVPPDYISVVDTATKIGRTLYHKVANSDDRGIAMVALIGGGFATDDYYVRDRFGAQVLKVSVARCVAILSGGVDELKTSYQSFDQIMSIDFYPSPDLRAYGVSETLTLTPATTTAFVTPSSDSDSLTTPDVTPPRTPSQRTPSPPIVPFTPQHAYEDYFEHFPLGVADEVRSRLEDLGASNRACLPEDIKVERAGDIEGVSVAQLGNDLAKSRNLGPFELDYREQLRGVRADIDANARSMRGPNNQSLDELMGVARPKNDGTLEFKKLFHHLLDFFEPDVLNNVKGIPRAVNELPSLIRALDDFAATQMPTIVLDRMSCSDPVMRSMRNFFYTYMPYFVATDDYGPFYESIIDFVIAVNRWGDENISDYDPDDSEYEDEEPPALPPRGSLETIYIDTLEKGFESLPAHRGSNANARRPPSIW